MNEKLLAQRIASGDIGIQVARLLCEGDGSFKRWLNEIFVPEIEKKGFLTRKFITYRESICVLLAYRELCDLKHSQTCADDLLKLRYDEQKYNVGLNNYLRENSFTINELFPINVRIALMRNVLNFAFRERELAYMQGIVNVNSVNLTIEEHQFLKVDRIHNYTAALNNEKAIHEYSEALAASLWYLSHNMSGIDKNDIAFTSQLAFDIVTAKICSIELKQLCKANGSFQVWLQELFHDVISDHGFTGTEIINYWEMVKVLIAYRDICILHEPPMTVEEYCDTAWTWKSKRKLAELLAQKSVSLEEIITYELRLAYIQNIINYSLRAGYIVLYNLNDKIERSFMRYPEEYEFLALRPRAFTIKYRGWNQLASLSARIWEKQFPSDDTTDPV